MSFIQLLDSVHGTVATLVAPLTDAQDSAETIVVTSDAPAESASSVHLGAEQLRFRSRTQPSDVLRQSPAAGRATSTSSAASTPTTAPTSRSSRTACRSTSCRTATARATPTRTG